MERGKAIDYRGADARGEAPDVVNDSVVLFGLVVQTRAERVGWRKLHPSVRQLKG